MSLYELLSLLVNVIGLGFIAWQLAIAIRAFKAEHERQKKQVTFEYIATVRDTYEKSRRLINEKFGNDILTEANLIELLKDDQALTEIKNLLSVLEHISVGMNAGVFDKDLWYRMSVTFILRLHSRLKVYIEYAQKNNPYAYIEFDEVVRGFEERFRKKPDSIGNIKHS